MNFLTFNELDESSFSNAERINESRNFSKTNSNIVFISYRRKDRKLVVPIVELLNRVGANVYIDYLDDALPDSPNNSTASILRQRIKSSDKFILLATPNSKESKWMPWELGLGDGFNGFKNTIILPITNTSSSWSEQEYYRIYGFVNGTEELFPYVRKRWQISFPNGQRVDLKTWINS